MSTEVELAKIEALLTQILEVLKELLDLQYF